MEVEYCFECLQRQIQTDFRDKLIFNYPLPSSPLPFTSNALVQVSNSHGVVSPHFIFIYMRVNQHDCFTKYINEHCPEDIKPTMPEIKSNEAQIISDDGENKSLPGLGCNNLTFAYSSDTRKSNRER